MSLWILFNKTLNQRSNYAEGNEATTEHGAPSTAMLEPGCPGHAGTAGLTPPPQLPENPVEDGKHIFTESNFLTLPFHAPSLNRVSGSPGWP